MRTSHRTTLTLTKDEPNSSPLDLTTTSPTVAYPCDGDQASSFEQKEGGTKGQARRLYAMTPGRLTIFPCFNSHNSLVPRLFLNSTNRTLQVPISLSTTCADNITRLGCDPMPSKHLCYGWKGTTLPDIPAGYSFPPPQDSLSSRPEAVAISQSATILVWYVCLLLGGNIKMVVTTEPPVVTPRASPPHFIPPVPRQTFLHFNKVSDCYPIPLPILSFRFSFRSALPRLQGTLQHQISSNNLPPINIP